MTEAVTSIRALFLFMKTILVTGGAGFIGSHLCSALLKEKHRVICLDDFSTGNPRNIDLLFRQRNFEFVEHDLKRPIYFAGISEIYHLASPASPKAYQKDPIGTLRTNAEGTRNVLDLARQGPIKVLLASTSEVYGDPAESPQKESYNGNVSSTGPRSCYDEGKRYAEALVTAYHRTTGMDTKIARIFNTYGPRMDELDGRAIPNFLWQVRNSNVLTIYGNGQQTRSFCYVTDMVEGLKKLMASGEHGPINLGNPDERTILDLAKLILKLTHSSAKIVYHAKADDDPQRRKPDITKAKERLGWTPKVTLEKGLKTLCENQVSRV